METVWVRVGGERFETTATTLAGSEYFSSALSGRWATPKELFVDRDPDGFRHVLRLLRDPEYAFPFGLWSHELDFYGVKVERPGNQENRRRYRNPSVRFAYALLNTPSWRAVVVRPKKGVDPILRELIWPCPVARETESRIETTFCLNRMADDCDGVWLELTFDPKLVPRPPVGRRDWMISGLLESALGEIRLLNQRGQTLQSLRGETVVRRALLRDVRDPRDPEFPEDSLLARVERERPRVVRIWLPLLRCAVQNEFEEEESSEWVTGKVVHSTRSKLASSALGVVAVVRAERVRDQRFGEDRTQLLLDTSTAVLTGKPTGLGRYAFWRLGGLARVVRDFTFAVSWTEIPSAIDYVRISSLKIHGELRFEEEEILREMANRNIFPEHPVYRVYPNRPLGDFDKLDENPFFEIRVPFPKNDATLFLHLDVTNFENVVFTTSGETERVFSS